MKKTILFSLLFVCFATPSLAAFEKIEDREANFAAERERYLKQLDDISKMQEAMQENNTILKDILAEMQKQTEILGAIYTEEKKQSAELPR